MKQRLKITRCAYADCMKVIPAEYGKPGVAQSRCVDGPLICSDCGVGEALLPTGMFAGKAFDRHFKLPRFERAP